MHHLPSLLFLSVALSSLGCADPDAGTVGIGDDMPELAWEGYVNEAALGLSTDQPFSDYGTRALANTGRRYAMLHTAASF
jgi:hypothetical protein